MENIIQEKLNSLKQSLSSGCSYLIKGGIAGITSGVLYFIIIKGLYKGTVKIPVIEIPLPLPLAVIAFLVISFVLGWIGVLFFNRAKRTMYCLEFEEQIEKEEIKTALLSSSIISTSKLVVNVLCVCTILLIQKPVMIFTIIVFKIQHYPSVLLLMAVGLFFSLPYLYVWTNPRFSYFNPVKWNRGSWLIKLILKQNLRELMMNNNTDLLKFQPALHKKLTEVFASTYLNSFSELLNKVFRRNGIRMFFDYDKLLDEEFPYFEKEVAEKLSKIEEKIEKSI